MNILSICSEPTVMSVLRLVVLFIKIIRVAVPIALIIVVMLKFAGAVTKHDDELLNKATKSIVPNAIAAVLIFLIPSFVDIVVRISFPNSDYTKCISGISISDVYNAYNSKMDELIAQAESSLEYTDYSNALAYLQYIKDPDKRAEYEAKLEAIKELIDAKNNDDKKKCTNKNNYAKVNYSNFKWFPYQAKSGPAAKFNSNILPYAVWAPENTSDLNGVSLPLIVWLHGSGELSYQENMSINNFVKVAFPKEISKWKDSGLASIPAIIVAPQASGQWASNADTRDKNMESIKALIEYAKEAYNIDLNNVVLMGHSIGGNGVIHTSYEMQKKYSKDYFSKLVPFSATSGAKYPSNDVDSGYAYFSKKDIRGYSENSNNKPFFDWIGKSDSFRVINNTSHGELPGVAMRLDENSDGVSDIVEWLFGKNEECVEDEDISGPGGENPAAGIKATCNGEYENGYGLAKLNVTVTSGSATKYEFYLDNKSVQSGESTSYTAVNTYTLLINPKVTITSTNGQSTTISCDVKHSNYISYNKNGYYYSVKASTDKKNNMSNPYPNNKLSYFLYVPPNVSPTEKLPLIMGLHGGYGWSVPCNGSTTSEANQTNHYLKTALYYRRANINNDPNANPRAVIITPSNMSCGWEGSIYKAFDIMYAYIKLYNIDFDSIVVTGSSQGGYGTLYSGFLEEHVLYKVRNDSTTLDSVASMYGTTADQIKSYNKTIGVNISYSNKSKNILSNGTTVIVRAKNNNDQRSLFSVLVPMSPAKNLTRCAFTPSTIYDEGGGCKKTPPYELKTPIWVITSNDEYTNIQKFAKELTAYYKGKGNIRYTVLTNLKSIGIASHNTQNAIIGKTTALDWMIKQKRGRVNVQNDSELSSIEASLGKNFSKVWSP